MAGHPGEGGGHGWEGAGRAKRVLEQAGPGGPEPPADEPNGRVSWAEPELGPLTRFSTR